MSLDRRDFLRLGAGAVAAAALPAGAQPARRPNVVVILADDLGYADVGFQGCRDYATPHLDSLVRQGVRCTNGYVSHPFCSPTRAGLMTGRYQQRFGHENNPAWLPDDTRVGLPVDQITLPQVLSAAGYATGAVGKWHLGAAPCFHPLARGFREYYGFLGGGHQYLPGAKGSNEYTIPLQRNRESVAQTEYMTDELSREAVAFIGRHKAEPFFLYLAYNAVHTPLQAPPKYLDRVKDIADPRRRTYAAMGVAMDDGVGQVLAALRANGLENDTLVWFMSDNGGPPEQVAPTRNTPLRGNKGNVLEGGVRVPCALQWRGTLPAGKVYDEPVSSLDVMATAAALAGAKLPTDRPLDSVDLVPYLTGRKTGAPHQRLHWRTGGGQAWAVREGSLKLLKQGQRPPELYDLAADIGESRDLAADRPQDAARLLAAHDAWSQQLVPPIFENPGAAKK
jgi:arylsulfatase A-like enzyme